MDETFGLARKTQLCFFEAAKACRKKDLKCTLHVLQSRHFRKCRMSKYTRARLWNEIDEGTNNNHDAVDSDEEETNRKEPASGIVAEAVHHTPKYTTGNVPVEVDRIENGRKWEQSFEATKEHLDANVIDDDDFDETLDDTTQFLFCKTMYRRRILDPFECSKAATYRHLRRLRWPKDMIDAVFESVEGPAPQDANEVCGSNLVTIHEAPKPEVGALSCLSNQMRRRRTCLLWIPR